MPKAVKTFVFKVQCYGMGCFGTYFTHAQRCENLRVQSATERDCFGTYFTHAQSCDNVHVQSAMEWAASVHTLHMPKAVKTLVFKVQCYGMGCFGTYFTHAQRCDILCVQCATERTASVHILRMPKAVITFMFKVLWNGLLRYILYTCPKVGKPSCSKCYRKFCVST